jgi:hypothetical protein
MSPLVAISSMAPASAAADVEEHSHRSIADGAVYSAGHGDGGNAFGPRDAC